MRPLIAGLSFAVQIMGQFNDRIGRGTCLMQLRPTFWVSPRPVVAEPHSWPLPAHDSQRLS
jgi:hypothetical protein